MFKIEGIDFVLKVAVSLVLMCGQISLIMIVRIKVVEYILLNHNIIC